MTGRDPLPRWIVYVNYGNRRSWWCCDRYAGESAAVRGGPDVSTVYGDDDGLHSAIPVVFDRIQVSVSS